MGKVLKIVGGVVVVLIVLGAIAGGGEDEPEVKGVEKVVTVDDSEPPADTEPEPKADPAPEPEPEPQLTRSQENAIESAEDYLDFGAFSRSGLIEQLEFEGFPERDARFAVRHIKVDWNKQALKSAEDYLDFGSFSRSGLAEQLEFEGFTPAQAEYAVSRLF